MAAVITVLSIQNLRQWCI